MTHTSKKPKNGYVPSSTGNTPKKNLHRASILQAVLQARLTVNPLEMYEPERLANVIVEVEKLVEKACDLAEAEMD